MQFIIIINISLTTDFAHVFLAKPYFCTKKN